MNRREILARGGWSMMLAVLLQAGGCAGLGTGAVRPEVGLANLQVKEMRGLETVFLVELRILNPGDVPLRIRGIDCELKVDGRHFATGLSGASLDIPAYGSAIMPVPAYASMLDMVASVIARLQAPPGQGGTIEPLRYEIAGHIRVAGGTGGSRNLPFASKGELALPGQPPR